MKDFNKYSYEQLSKIIDHGCEEHGLLVADTLYIMLEELKKLQGEYI